LIYGIGEALLAVKLSDPKAGIIVTKEEAHKEMAEFFEKHPKILKFKEKQEKFLRKHGYYTQLFGTKRRLPQIYSNDKQEVAYAIRLGLNFPCQGAAANMTNFGAILVYWLMRQGKLPRMLEVATVHDAAYFYSKPEYINTWTVFKIWDILRNPSTKKYFGFQVDDVDMSMDFSIGRSMAEELPFIPGYDYRKMLQPDFSVEEYMEEHKKYKNVIIKDYPKLFSKEIKQYEEDFKGKLRLHWLP
jgi:DNA polymerase I-like protein with 3'-5' exonuclease and polymerase domains